MKNNYEVKYAIFPIHVDEETLLGYMVSKCYKLGFNVECLCNGKCKEEYSVFFPFEKDVANHKQLSSTNEWSRTEPSMRSSAKWCTDRLFDSFDEALEYANELNIKHLEASSILLNDELFKNRLRYYSELQDAIEKGTDDLEVGAVLKEQSIIVKRNNKYELLDCSLYDFIKYNKNHIKVWNATQSEYDMMKMHIDTNNSNVLKHYAEFFLKNKSLMISDADARIITITDVNGAHHNYYLDIENMNMYDEDGMNLAFKDELKFNNDLDGTIVYTLEDYYDIIKSYLPYYTGEEIKMNGKVYTKRITIKR